ncbi:MAG: signal peptidase II [Candidatus Moranbacteria bacterium]|nr:signal peptidase II [Candidatus Moranbacteria bacterium]
MKCESTNKNSFLLIILLIFIDQLAKYIIRSFGGFYICNKGVAFGISLPNWAILGFIIAIVVFVSFLILNLKFEIRNELFNFKFKNFNLNSNFKFKISNYSLILILAGALSNLFDRLHYGCVIDFIDFKVWPIFNLADIFICLGVFLLIIKSSSPLGRRGYK